VSGGAREAAPSAVASGRLVCSGHEAHLAAARVGRRHKVTLVDGDLVGVAIDVDASHVDLLGVIKAVASPQVVVVVQAGLELDAVEGHSLGVPYCQHH
jgi:hypothetical protein